MLLAGRVLGVEPGLNFGFPSFSAAIISRPRPPRRGRRAPRARAPAGAAPPRLGGEQFVERVEVDLGALELRPGVLEMVRRIGAADDVDGQTALGFEPCECFERRGE